MRSGCGTTKVGGIEVNLLGFAAVGAGAAAGAWLRWWLALTLNPIFPTVPIGTFAANMLGGLLIGLAMGVIAHFEALPAEIRLLVTTGFLGGLTTFSTFSAETVTLLVRQQFGWAAVQVIAHVFGSILMTFAGIGLVRLALR
jgi:fluoride exporter